MVHIVLTLRMESTHACQSIPKGFRLRITVARVCAGSCPANVIVETSWTQGFFPGMLWLLVERQQLAPQTVPSEFDRASLIKLAHRWQDGFRHMSTDAFNHDQGFRFQLSFGK